MDDVVAALRELRRPPNEEHSHLLGCVARAWAAKDWGLGIALGFGFVYYQVYGGQKDHAR